MAKSNNKDSDEELKELIKKIPLLHWGRLRFIGSLRILSLIPFVGAGIVAVLNLPQFSEVNAKKVVEDICTIGSLLVFLSSLFAANVLYHIFCPAMIKKFETLGDLYQQQLAIKKDQKDLYPEDVFNADLKHVAKSYTEHLAKSKFARWASFFLFIFSLTALFFFLYKFRLLLIDPYWDQKEIKMEIGLKEIMDIFQTIAIIGTLVFTLWQWKKTRESIIVDNYSKIIGAMNSLRDIRIKEPDLERALFESRSGMQNGEIRKRVYGVELANIFEWVYISHDKGLIGDKEWADWSSMWKRVILSDKSMRKLVEDETIYTFSLDAHKLIKSWIAELEQKEKQSSRSNINE